MDDSQCLFLLYFGTHRHNRLGLRGNQFTARDKQMICGRLFCSHRCINNRERLSALTGDQMHSSVHDIISEISLAASAQHSRALLFI
jgi:hypothetical protein